MITQHTNIICPICKQTKDENSYYLLEKRIDNEIIFKNLFLQGCKECLKPWDIKWETKLEGETSIVDYSKIAERCKQRQLNDLITKLNILEKDLLSKSEVLKFMGIDKNALKPKINMGLIREFRIPNPNKFNKIEYAYFRYYCLEDVKLAQWHKENGYFVQRCHSSIRRGAVAITLKPYIYVGENNYQCIFINETERKKPCTVCLEIKSFESFHGNINAKDGFGNVCSTCARRESRARYKSLDEIDRKEKIKYAKRWARDNKDKIRQYKKDRNKNAIFRIRRAIRSRINHIMDYMRSVYGWSEDSKWQKTALKSVGCSKLKLKIYLEAQFVDGMSWNNYGPGYKIDSYGKPIFDETGNTIPVKEWHIDHKCPVSKFNLSDVEQLKKVNHYTNLQPLWSEDNLRKGDNVDEFALRNYQGKILPRDEDFERELEKIKQLITNKYDKTNNEPQEMQQMQGNQGVGTIS